MRLFNAILGVRNLDFALPLGEFSKIIIYKEEKSNLTL